MKVVVLVSSGIDSPVAARFISEYAEELFLVHADIQPYSDDQETKTFLSIAQHLSTIMQHSITTFTVSHGPALKSYLNKANKRYTCIFCKRMLIRYADEIAKRQGASAIVMGDSLGQVASQTLQNIRVIDAVTTYPILRPLLGLDKEDIIYHAKKMGTFSLSTTQMKSCQAVPNKPATQAKLNAVIAEEKKIAIDQITTNAMNNAKKITFN
ncbi:MAG: hypothetical protein R6U21_08450 [Thermoplasmatota archaeon]